MQFYASCNCLNILFRAVPMIKSLPCFMLRPMIIQTFNLENMLTYLNKEPSRQYHVLDTV